MRARFRYPADTWAVMPDPAAAADSVWIQQQVDLAAAEYPDRVDLARLCATQALVFRREGIDTSLYFRPPSLPATAILQVTVTDTDATDADFTADQWIPDGIDAGIPPVVSEFETEHCSHGIRVAYVSDQRNHDGQPLAGLIYALRFDGIIAAVFSELADTMTIGLLEWQADPLVESMTIVP